MKLSIVTPCFNSVATISKTLTSVLNIKRVYDAVELEHIIVDGGSNDGTLKCLEDFRDSYDSLDISFTVISGQDSGIYDAINKGIKKCTGEWIGIINSDDYYSPNAFDVFEHNLDDYDVVYGDLVMFDDIGNEFIKTPKKLNKIKSEMSIYHPSSFVRREIYETYGLYDINYKLASDYKFFLHLYISGCKFKYFNNVIAFYFLGGATGGNIIKSWLELKKIQEELGVNKFRSNVNFLTLCTKRFLINLSKVLPS